MDSYYSEQVPKILNIKHRSAIGRQILGVLKQHVGGLRNARVLDFGCSNGVITNIIAPNVKSVVGVDIDPKAINIAKKSFKRNNLKFLLTKGLNLNFKKNSFDIVIANQIYEFVDDDVKLMKEIYRLLKKGGVCFFGARNKYAIVEAQYNIPFLSWVPKDLADVVVTRLKKGSEFVGKYRSFKSLSELVDGFKLHDYTLKIIQSPGLYGFRNLRKFEFVARIIPIKYFYFLIPNYIWILEK